MLSRRTGCNIETIRYYEKIGLLPLPARSDGGHRLYGHGHLMRLGFVRRARELGFTLDERRSLLQMNEDRERPCSEPRMVPYVHFAVNRRDNGTPYHSATQTTLYNSAG